MTADERLSLILAKVERAKKHINDFDLAVRTWLFEANPYQVATKRDPQTRELIYYCPRVTPFPYEFATTVGDAIQNLRSALDHLGTQLVIANGKQPTRHTAFPIFDDLPRYEAESKRIVKGMRQDAIDAIKAVKPYKGGNDNLWRLHRLNIVDKHRLLIAVGSVCGAHRVTPSVQRHLRKLWTDSQGSKPFPWEQLGSLMISTSAVRFPLQTGDELLREPPDAEVYEQMQFTFDVAFNEPVIRRQSVRLTLRFLREAV